MGPMFDGFTIIVSDIEKPTTWLGRIKQAILKPLLPYRNVVISYQSYSSGNIIKIAQRTKDEFLSSINHIN